MKPALSRLLLYKLCHYRSVQTCGSGAVLKGIGRLFLCLQVGTSASATPQTLRAQLQKLQQQEEEAERLRAKLVAKVEVLREEAQALRGLDQEKRQLEEQVGCGGSKREAHTLKEQVCVCTCCWNRLQHLHAWCGARRHKLLVRTMLLLCGTATKTQLRTSPPKLSSLQFAQTRCVRHLLC